jgi:bifunctional ADP-heptose synthase (sugar kinase/adenylyltransferase)
LNEIRPDLLVKGGATAAGEIACRELVECYGGQVRLTSKVEGFSTTSILASLAGRDRGDESVIADLESVGVQRASSRPR